MNPKAKYNKVPFKEWKEKQTDWKDALIGHKFLCKFQFLNIILDYEESENIFLCKSIGGDGQMVEYWKPCDFFESNIICILEEPTKPVNAAPKTAEDLDNSRKLLEEYKKSYEENRKMHPYEPHPWTKPLQPPYIPHRDDNGLPWDFPYRVWCKAQGIDSL